MTKRDILKGALIVSAVVVGIYVLSAVFIPLSFFNRTINKEIERQTITRSTQYIESQVSALTRLYSKYDVADTKHRVAILGEMCLIQNKISQSEVPTYILPTLSQCK